jgi:hypothetical protein
MQTIPSHTAALDPRVRLEASEAPTRLDATGAPTWVGAGGVTRRPAWRWRALSLLLRTIGQASDGIRLGYHHGFDSGPMLDYVYANRARGRFGYGRLADRVYLDSIGWRAIRARKALLQDVLRTEIARHHAAGRPTVLLDVAAGPGRYLQELAVEATRAQSSTTLAHHRSSGLTEGGAASRAGAPPAVPAGPHDVADRSATSRLGTAPPSPAALTIICRDLDAAGLAQGRARATALRLTSLRYERGDACDPASLAQVTPRPNVVVASGLYELLDEALIQRSMVGVYALLPPGGRFVFTTQVSHPQLELIANVLPNRFGEPWVMACRALAEVESYAHTAGFRVLTSQLEPHGLFAVTTAEKPVGGLAA